ncbi:tripartite motif-containing protein 2-like [Branchiostoma floridae]|uniref:RING-type E3 ubiquitin transferase n=1 Tax=Branchiostoma floridae TaxID=7739 RepID=A0A9J7KHN1_BRAFL|nr:tripartite motif-containing protein 2-like [Branchiostoma floridae]
MAAVPTSFREQICEELTCSICLELFTRPKVLPCQHTFCQDCLQDHAGRGGAFQCPNCRQQVRLPPQGVAGLPDNHLVTSLSERLQNQDTISGETREQPQSGNRCSFHPTEKLKLYCKPCQAPLCVDCVEEGHDGHPNIISLTKATQEKKSTVQALINEGRDILETYCSFIRGLREKEKNLNEQKEQRDNSIIQAFNQMVQKLTERKDFLLSDSQQNYSENLEKIQTERDNVLADVNELSAACQLAEQELQLGCVEFLSQQTALTEVVGKYRETAAPTPVQTQPAVFQPTDTPVPLLGHVTVQSLPSAPIPVAPASSNGAAGGIGQDKGQVKPQCQSVTFGEYGSESGQFKSPLGATVSDEGEIFVADQGNQRIQVFTLQGTFLRQFPTIVSDEHQMEPGDVARDGEGNLWVVGWTESADFAVQYNKQGRVLRKFDLQNTEWYRGVAVDTRRNHILITQITGGKDNTHGEVLVFRPDGSLVRSVEGKWGSFLWRRQEMKKPRYITVDGGGNILVSDNGNHCIHVCNEDGQFLFQFGGYGSGEGQLKGPRGICTDRAGNIIVADYRNNRIEMFDKKGRFLKHIATDMMKPLAVAMGTQGQLLVTDDKKQTCPICRQQARPPPQGVEGLPDNHLVTSLCERLQNQATLSGETREQSQSGNRCSFHPSEKLKLYCKPCQVPLCVDCLEEGHDGHPNIISLAKATQENKSTIQALINEGRDILESYCSVIRGLRENERGLNEQKEQRDNTINQTYKEMVQKLTERKDLLLSNSQQNHSENLEKIQTERDRVLADVNELSAACDRAEQELQQGLVKFLSQQTALTEVVGKYREKAAPTPVQTQPAVFQPTDTPVPVLGHVTVQSLASAPIPAAIASTNGAAGGIGQHHGNQRQMKLQSQSVTFGGDGSESGQFKSPRGVTVSDEEEIFVADCRNKRIQVFTLQGTFVRQFPTVVSDEHQMEPGDVALDGEGNLWVVGDTESADVAVQYNKQGRMLRKFDLQNTGIYRGVAVDTRRNHILITQITGDKNNTHGEVLAFRPDGSLLRAVEGKWWDFLLRRQGMKWPQYITVGREGNILVSDYGNHYIHVCNEDGQFLFQFGGKGSGEGQLNDPCGICTDRAGNIIVADIGNKRVEMFDKTGKFLKHIATDMGKPRAVAMGTQGQLVVTDDKKHTVSIFYN